MCSCRLIYDFILIDLYGQLAHYDEAEKLTVKTSVSNNKYEDFYRSYKTQGRYPEASRFNIQYFDTYSSIHIKTF